MALRQTIQGPHCRRDGLSRLSVNAAGNTVSVLNDVAGGHGLTIGAASTSLTGGTNSSALTLADSSATLAVGTATSGELQVINATNTAGVTAVTIGGATDQSNTISATGTNGVNNLTANATTGTNDIEAKTNNIGVTTANSVNDIGNANTSTNTITGLTTTITSSNGGVNSNDQITMTPTTGTFLVTNTSTGSQEGLSIQRARPCSPAVLIQRA